MTLETAVTIAFACVVAWDCWRRYLTRPTLEIVDLKFQVVQLRQNCESQAKSLDDACLQFANKFEGGDKRIAAVEKAIDKLEPGARRDPLGSTYSARQRS